MSDKKIEDLKNDIQTMEKELAEAKKTLREMRTKGLREAMEAKKLADEAVKEEMKALGYDYSRSEYQFNPFSGWRRIL
jgi:phage-related tail protein|tara:strand:- start:125 stop:358 length:234 start_codon:yes stop_codon:yes gene_type:complete